MVLFLIKSFSERLYNVVSRMLALQEAENGSIVINSYALPSPLGMIPEYRNKKSKF